jgi:hypothetical protein
MEKVVLNIPLMAWGQRTPMEKKKGIYHTNPLKSQDLRINWSNLMLRRSSIKAQRPETNHKYMG